MARRAAAVRRPLLAQRQTGADPRNLACLDYSAVLYGKLAAYRLDEETRIDPHKFVWVDVERPQANQ
jgi:hypothetical protein